MHNCIIHKRNVLCTNKCVMHKRNLLRTNKVIRFIDTWADIDNM